MKNDKLLAAFSRLYRLGLILVGLTVLLPSCLDSDKIGANYYTFTNKMMGQFLQERPEQFSEFTRLLDTTKVMGLLNGYGEYTCFAPTNEAMLAFYQTRGKSSLKEFPLDSLKKIAYDHIIKGETILKEDFLEGRLPNLTMSDRFISVSFATENEGQAIYVNKTSKIIERDDTVSNGVLHIINEVINPTELNLVEAIASDNKFSLFFEALKQTGLTEKLAATVDESYDPDDYSSLVASPYVQGSGSIDELPESRKYGFTALLESDSTLAANGITDLASMASYAARIYNVVYPEDASVNDVKNPRNSLNRFIAYHLINKQLSFSKLISDYDTKHMLKTHDMYEYIETMCPNTLLEVKIERSSGEVNLINKSTKTGNAVRIVTTNYDNDAINGVYHEIDKILVYDLSVASELASKRLRMDAASFFPEFTNNNMRGNGKVQSWVFPKGYIEGLTSSKETRFCYLNSFGGYLDYQGDEVYLNGMYDFSLVTPPIPAGTYEVRFGYQPTPGRGAAQLYWDSIPCGIPLDLRIQANDPLVGFVVPGSDPEDLSGYENDKMLRNRGYMKGPATFLDHINVWYGNKIARNSSQYLRRILGIYTFDKAQKHVFTVKAVREGQFMFDFLEFVPVEMLESEDIY